MYGSLDYDYFGTQKESFAFEVINRISFTCYKKNWHANDLLNTQPDIKESIAGVRRCKKHWKEMIFHGSLLTGRMAEICEK
ncbi:hypothetical protein GCM10009865_39700 [Aeromicrobium ponti]